MKFTLVPFAFWVVAIALVGISNCRLVQARQKQQQQRRAAATAVNGNLFTCSRKKANRCGRLRRGIYMHQLVVTTTIFNKAASTTCQEKCIRWPFLASKTTRRKWKCGRCPDIVSPTPPTIPTVLSPTLVAPSPVIAAPAPQSALSPKAPSPAATAPMVAKDPATVPAPKTPASSLPAAPSSDEFSIVCSNFTRSIVAFWGHNQVQSSSRGVVNATWNPALVYDAATARLVWCGGNFTYHVLVVPGVYNASQPTSMSETTMSLLNAAKKFDNRATMYETNQTSWVGYDFIPGATYSVLVTAQTPLGQVSLNRAAALVDIATVDPKIKANFTRVVILPEPTNGLQVVSSNRTNTVDFIGQHPPEVVDVKQGDFVYFFDSNGNATLGRCTRVFIATATSTAGSIISWDYVPATLRDMFDDLDLSAELSEHAARIVGKNSITMDAAKAARLRLELANLHPNIMAALCEAAYYSDSRNVADCIAFQKGNGRRRLLFNFDALVALYETVKDFAVNVLADYKNITEKLNIDNTTVIDQVGYFLRGTCSLSKNVTNGNGFSTQTDAKFETGVKVGMTTKFRIKTEVSLTTFRARLEFTGEMTVAAYVLAEASRQFLYEPPPLDLLSLRQYFLFLVGPVPVVVVNRQSIKAFVGIAAALEGKALVKEEQGYAYVMSYTFDDYKSPKFVEDSKLTRLVTSALNPRFDASASISAEAGFMLVWDTFFYNLVQGTVVADLGLRAELEVGMTEESILVTDPYFIVLDKFKMSAFVRVRVLVGFNNEKTDVVPSIPSPDDKTNICTYSNQSFTFPDFKPRSFNRNEALDVARNKVIQRTQELDGYDLEYGLDFVVYSDSYVLFGTPDISIKLKSNSTCVADDAIAQTYEVAVNKPPVNILNDVKGGLWYTNFDGVLLDEVGTGWIVSGSRSDMNSFSIRLPIAAANKSSFDGYRVYPNASVYIRVTPEIYTVSDYIMLAKLPIANVELECCRNTDCKGSRSQCVNRKCVFPSTPTLVPQPNPPRRVFPDGFMAGTVGDPHIYTFDRVRYGCQAQGEFILFTGGPSGALVQGRFKLTTSNRPVSFTTAVAARADNVSTVVEVSISGNSTDPFQVLINGTSRSNPFSAYSDPSVSVSVTGNRLAISLPTSGLVVTVRYVPASFRFFEVNMQVPHFFQNQTTRGLFGSPDSNPLNDLTAPNGTVLSVANLGGLLDAEGGFKYCITWAISNEAESIFTYDEIQGFDFYKGNKSYPGSVDLNAASSEVKSLCGNNAACLLDGIELGIDGARSLLEEEVSLSLQTQSGPFRALPNIVAVGLETDIVLTVNLTGMAVSPSVQFFHVYAVNTTSLAVGTSLVATLLDSASKLGDDTSQGDLIFSSVIRLRAPTAGQSFSYKAVPVVNGVANTSDSTLSFVLLHAVRSYRDNTPPRLINFTATSPTRVNVTNSNALVNFELVIQDDISGLWYGELTAEAERFTFDAKVSFLGRPMQNGQSQTYNCTLLIPMLSSQMKRKLRIVLHDKAGNVGGLAAPFAVSTFPQEIDVINTLDRSKPPEILDLVVSPSTINVTLQPVNVTVNITVREANPSASVGYLSASWYGLRIRDEVAFFSPGGGVAINVSFTLQFPRYIYAGSHPLSLYVHNQNQVATTLQYLGDFLRRNWTGQIQVQNRIVDKTPPSLVGFSFFPSTVNISTGATLVAIQVSVTDDLSGLFLPYSRISSLFNQLPFVSLENATRVSEGVYNVSLIVPRSTPVGVSVLYVEELQDNVGNRVSYNPANLTRLGFSTNITVVK